MTKLLEYWDKFTLKEVQTLARYMGTPVALLPFVKVSSVQLAIINKWLEVHEDCAIPIYSKLVDLECKRNTPC